MASAGREKLKTSPRYRTYQICDMEMAVNAVKNSGLSLRAASKMYSVPYITLRRHVTEETSSFKPGRKLKLSDECEKELLSAVTGLQDRGFGVSKGEFLELAAEVAQHHDRSPFKNATPSNKWYRRFKIDHDLALRSPENLSVARCKMSTEEVKKEFFNKLKEIYDDLFPKGLKPEGIFNLDESGVNLVTKSGKTVAVRGSSHIYQKTGGERGENISVLVTVNATGSIILPPTVIFRGHSLNEDLMANAPVGTIFAHSPKSFIDKELFTEWFKRFTESIPPARPVLVLMDGHVAHISLDIIEIAREQNILLLCFPPHTTHLLQPLDVGVFKSLKSAVKTEASKLMRKNKKEKLNRYDFFKVFTPAWYKAITPSNIVGGFRGAGVWPFNPDAVILPGQEKSRLPDGISTGPTRDPTSSSNSSNESTLQPASSDAVTTQEGPQLGLSGLSNDKKSPVVQALKELFTRADEPAAPRSRNITKTRLLTCDEFYQEVKEKELLKLQKENKKPKEKTRKKITETKKRPKPKKSRLEDPASDPDIPDSGSDGSEDNERCGTCNKSFQREFNGEEWICCIDCRTWYHLSCQNISEYKADFLCDDCTPVATLLLV